MEGHKEGFTEHIFELYR